MNRMELFNNGKKDSECRGAADIYFAGGCFWGTEKYFESIRGVLATDVGYANGSQENPSYEEVCSGRTGAAETVHVKYDPQCTPLPFLLEMYYQVIDPVSVNRQGNDKGTQYRTGIYYVEEEDREVIEASLKELQRQYDAPLAVECLPLGNYYPAEEYHQKYLDKNPQGYCHIPSSMFRKAAEAKAVKVEAGESKNRESKAGDVHGSKQTKPYTRPDEETLKRTLSPRQYDVTRNGATEPPFQNEYWDFYERGIYVDITTGEPLFLSSDKFESGCGWPSFSRPIRPEAVNERQDLTHGMQRIEVRSFSGDAHLGHVFQDGPESLGGLRYCINSASLRFIPLDQMEAEGYGEYLKLLEAPRLIEKGRL